MHHHPFFYGGSRWNRYSGKETHTETSHCSQKMAKGILEMDEPGAKKKRTRVIVIVAVVVVVIVIAVVIGCVVYFTKRGSSHDPTPATKTINPTPTGLPGADGPYQHAVVATDAGPCSEIGRDILKRNGSAVDSAVASLFCIGIINMHSAGIGGGGFMVVYNRSRRFAEVFDFREEAPGKANSTMYANGSMSSTVGATAAGVPGEVRGFHAAWKSYGKLPWKDLVQPSIDLAKNGFQFGYSAHYAATRESVLSLIKNDSGLRELLMNKDGEVKTPGELLKMPKLARTLERIRDDPDSFYTGDLAQDIVKDIQEGGGIFTLEDLKNYKAKRKRPLEGIMGDYQWFSNPPPGSGAVLSLILNILKGYNMTYADVSTDNRTVLTYHRITEAFKFAYAYRALLGDQDFANVTEILKKMTDPVFGEALRQRIWDNQTFSNFTHYGDFYTGVVDQGTSHMSVIAPNGDSVSATTTINLYFGGKYRSTRTGIIYNNEMDDFSTPGVKNAFEVPPSKANFIYPGKRPLSSMAPCLFIDNKGVARFSAGASGGTKITSAISLVVMRYLWFNQTLSEAVVEPRFHHQLVPMYIRIDRDSPLRQVFQDGLRKLGHEVLPGVGYAVVQAVATNEDGSLYGKSDPRKHAWAAGF